MSRATKLRLRSLISISAALKIGSAARAPMMLAMSAVIHSLGIQGRAAFTCCVAGFAAMRRCVSCDVIGSLMSQFHHSFFRSCVAWPGVVPRSLDCCKVGLLARVSLLSATALHTPPLSLCELLVSAS